MLIGLAYFVVIWVGYGLYAKSRAKGSAKATLSRAMRRHRDLWAERMLYRDNRIGDAALLANQERVVGFFRVDDVAASGCRANCVISRK